MFDLIVEVMKVIGLIVLSAVVKLPSPSEISSIKWRTKKNVESALQDLRLYLEALPNSQTRKVFTDDAVHALLWSLFLYPLMGDFRNMFYDYDPDFRARVAMLMVQSGLGYLLETHRIKRELKLENVDKVLDSIRYHLDPTGTSPE